MLSRVDSTLKNVKSKVADGNRKEGEYQCMDCHDVFGGYDEAVQHISIRHCEITLVRNYRKYEEYLNQRLSVNELVEESVTQCRICNQRFATELQKYEHLHHIYCFWDREQVHSKMKSASVKI